MKKLTLLLFALFFWTGAWAQVNIVSGKSAVVDNTNTGNGYSEAQLLLITNGVKSNSEDSNVNLKLSKSGSNNVVDWFYIDFGETKTPKTVDITWTNCRPTSYKLYISNEVPTVGNYGTEVFDQTTAPDGGASTKSHSLAGTVSGRYISFVPDQNTYNGWGCIMSEFEVFEAYEQVLTGLTSNRYIYETHIHVPVNVTDQMGATYEGATTWSMPGCAGFSRVGDGFDFADISQDGYYTLTVTSTENPSQTASKKYGLVRNQPDEEIIPAIDVDNSFVIYSGELDKDAGELSGAWKTPNSKGWNKMNVGSKSSWRIHGFGTFGLKDANLGTDASEIKALYLDIYSLDNHTGTIEIESSSLASNLPFSLVPGWNHVAIEVNTTIAPTLKPKEAVVIHLDDATTKAIDEDMLVYNVYYSKVAPFIDNENPVMSSITVTSTTHNTATLTVKATDDNTSGTLTYTVKNSSEETVGTGSAVQNVDVTITITGLTPETNYAVGAFTVFATDPSGKSSTSMNVPAFTTSAAPTGLELTAGGHTILLQGKHYLDRVTNNWELIVSSTDEMSSLGPCYWTLNSGNANMQDNYTKSSDNKTLTICATSTTKPVLYNNFYVNFVTGGEANFGVVNNNDLTWEESGVESLNVIVSGNTASVTGPVTAADVSTIVTNAGSSAILDLTGATLSESVTINPTNRNAIVVVNGTNRTSDKIANLGETKNVIVYDGTYRRAATGYVIALIDDNNSQPAYDFVIDAQQDGVTYTRTVAAGKWVSYNSPASVAIPAGVTVYKATDATTTSVTFTKQESQNLGANVPVILHNNTNDDVVITSNNDKIDLNLTANGGGGAAINGTTIMQYGTARLIEANGDQFALQNNDLKRFNTGSKIGAFRVYFTGLSSTNARAIFLDGETTKIGSINANGEISVEDGIIYNLAGQRVQKKKSF